MEIVTQQGSQPVTLDGDAAKDSLKEDSNNETSDGSNDASADSSTSSIEGGSGTQVGSTTGIGDQTFNQTDENDRDADGWPNDLEALLGTNPDDFNSKPDGTYDPNFDYSVIYEAPEIVVEEEKSPNEVDPCRLTDEEIKDYQDQVLHIESILGGVKSPDGKFPATDLLNHPNRNVEPLKAYIDALIDKRNMLNECLTLLAKISCLGDKSNKYDNDKVQSVNSDPDVPDITSLEYERPVSDEVVDQPVVVDPNPAVDDGDPSPVDQPGQSDPGTPNTGTPGGSGGTPNTGTPGTSGPIVGTPSASVPSGETDDDQVVLEEDVEEEPREETQTTPTQTSETAYYQIIDDSVRIVASIEFKELLGSDFSSPLTSGVIQSGEEMLVTPAAKLLEIQALVRQMTQYNVKDLFEIFTNNKLSTVFRLMYKLYEDSNGELFLQVPIPNSIDDVYNDINTYLEDISAKEVNSSGITLLSEINSMISHTINDGGTLLEIGKNYACAVIYYFIFYVRCLQSLKVATEENVTGPQSIGAPEDGVNEFIQTDVTQNTNLDNLLNRDISLGLDVDEMNSLLVNKNIVRDDVAFSENLTRIFKALLISGLGLNPIVDVDSSEPSSSKMLDANNEMIRAVFSSGGLTSSSHDIQIATLLYPSNSTIQSVGAGSGEPDFFNYNYYNFQQNVDHDEHIVPLIYDTRKRFALGTGYSNYHKIIDMRKIGNIKGLCSFLMAERGLTKNLTSDVGNNLPFLVNLHPDTKLSLKNILNTYHTEGSFIDMGSFNNSYEDSDRTDTFYNIPVKLINSSRGSLGVNGGIRSRLIDGAYNKFKTYTNYDYNSDNKVSSGVQSSTTAFNTPNEVLIGRSMTGLLFETNYYNNEQTEENFDPKTFLNIFDSREKLPHTAFLENNGALDLSDLPFRFSGEYYGQGAQINEEGDVPYLEMLKGLRGYLNSVIDTSFQLFNRATSDVRNPQTRLEIMEDFFEKLGDFFWNEMGGSITVADTPGQNAMLLNILAHCGSDNDTESYKEEMYRKTFFVLSANFAEFLGTRYTSSAEGTFHDPATVLNGDISINADNRQQDDIGKTIDFNNYGLARPSIHDRLFGMWLKYCAPAGGLNKIFDLKHDGGSPSGADIAIEDYELTGNSSNQELGFGGGIFLRSNGEFVVASKLAAGGGGGYEVKYSTKHNSSTDGLRNLLYTDIKNDSKLNTQVYHSSDVKHAGGYKRSVKNIPGEPDFFTDSKIGRGFNSTFRHSDCKLTELLFKYADTFRDNFANSGGTLDIAFGSDGYDPLNNSNVFGSSSMFNYSTVNDYEDVKGMGTNKFSCLLMFYSIIAKIAIYFPTDVIIEKGTSKGKDDDKSKRRFFGPRWSARYAYVLSNALKGRDIDFDITGFTPSANEQTHYDAVKEIRDGILDHLREIQNTHVSCLKFLDTICQKITEEIQSLETSEIPASPTVANTPESDNIFSEHSELFNLQFSGEQQKKLSASLAVKLMTPSATFNNYYLPSSKDITPHQIGKMMKFFSQSGRNYLTNEIAMGDSNKNRSNKLIFSVGIPNGHIGKLMLDSPDVQSLGYNSIMPKSNSLIKMTINKINLLNPEDVKYIPKSYFFDTAKFVFNNSIILPDDPLRGFDSTGILTQLSDNKFIELSRLYHIGRDDTGAMRIAYVNGQTMRSLGQGLVDAGGSYEKKDIAESLLMNHLTDYYLKVYMRAVAGIDVDEDIYSFSSKKDITLYAGNDPDNDNFFMRNFYSKMASILNAMESSNYNNPSYLYEFNRLVNVAKRSNMFAQKKYFNRAILPKTFDRVFSILIDEGDFIPVAAYDQKNNQINTQNGYGESAKQSAINALRSFSDTQQATIPAVDGRGHTLNATPEDFNNIIGQTFVIDENELTDETIYQYYCTIEAVASEDFNIIRELESENNNITASEDNEIAYLSGIFSPGHNYVSEASVSGASESALTTSGGGQYVDVNAMAVNMDD